jgi:hypothetical protein
MSTSTSAASSERATNAPHSSAEKTSRTRRLSPSATTRNRQTRTRNAEKYSSSMPIIAAASMIPRTSSGDAGSACNLATAAHAPSSNKPKTTTCTECHLGLMALPNIDPAMLTSIAHETNRNGTPSTGTNTATTLTTAASVSTAAKTARVSTWPQRP